MPMSLALFTRVRYRTVPLWSVPKSGTERGCVHMGVEKDQAVHSKTSPETGRYGKVAQESERYDTISYHSVLVQTEAARYCTAFRTCLVSTGDTKLTTSDVEVEIRPNCTSLILSIVWSFENRPLTSTVYPLINLIHVNV